MGAAEGPNSILYRRIDRIDQWVSRGLHAACAQVYDARRGLVRILNDLVKNQLSLIQCRRQGEIVLEEPAVLEVQRKHGKVLDGSQVREPVAADASGDELRVQRGRSDGDHMKSQIQQDVDCRVGSRRGLVDRQHECQQSLCLSGISHQTRQDFFDMRGDVINDRLAIRKGNMHLPSGKKLRINVFWRRN